MHKLGEKKKTDRIPGQIIANESKVTTFRRRDRELPAASFTESMPVLKYVISPTRARHMIVLVAV